MPVDITIAPGSTDSTLKRQVFTYTGPALYATGGESLANTVRFGTIFAVLGGTISNGTALLMVQYDPATNKLLVFDMAGTEIAASTVLTAYTGRLEAVGR